MRKYCDREQNNKPTESFELSLSNNLYLFIPFKLFLLLLCPNSIEYDLKSKPNMGPWGYDKEKKLRGES